MRVLIGTPAGGGEVTVQYFLSALDTYMRVEALKKDVSQQIINQIPNYSESDPAHRATHAQMMKTHSLDIGFYTLSAESLLARGRNHIAAMTLYGGWDKLFFIDADTGWTFDQFFRLVSSPHPLTAGVVPLKTYPEYPNTFRTSLNFLPFQEDEKHFVDARRYLDATKKMAMAHGQDHVKVAFTGTGYLCIDRKVLMTLVETAKTYRYPNPQTGQPMTHWDFFDGGAINEQYFSEDWSFCDKARKAGFDVVIDTSVLLTHTGTHTFRAM